MNEPNALNICIFYFLFCAPFSLDSRQQLWRLSQFNKEKKKKKKKEVVGRREKRIRYGGMIFYKVSFIVVLHNRLLQVLLMLLFIQIFCNCNWQHYGHLVTLSVIATSNINLFWVNFLSLFHFALHFLMVVSQALSLWFCIT